MVFTKKDKVDFFDFFNLIKVRRVSGIVYQNTIFISLFFLYLIYYDSNYILIPYTDMAIVIVVSSFIITLLFYKFFRKNFTIFWALIYNLSFGIIMLYGVIWSNETLSKKYPISETVYIKDMNMEKHKKQNRKSGALLPVIFVDIKGYEHKIVFSEDSFKKVAHSRKLKIVLKEGYWGYWILKDYNLIVDN